MCRHFTAAVLDDAMNDPDHGRRSRRHGEQAERGLSEWTRPG